MNCDVTLSAKDFSRLHDALWRLDCLDKPEVSEYVKQIREALAGAYEQDQIAFDYKYALWNSVAEANGFKSSWSIYEVAGPAEEHPYQHLESIVYRDHFGSAPCYRSIEGKTWQDLYRAADLAIMDSGDTHHMHIEAFEEFGGVLELKTGS